MKGINKVSSVENTNKTVKSANALIEKTKREVTIRTSREPLLKRWGFRSKAEWEELRNSQKERLERLNKAFWNN